MVNRSCRIRKAVPAVAACVLSLALASGTALPDATESIRGTVDRISPLILALRDVQYQDGSKAGKTVLVVVNRQTVYFTGAQRANREDILPGLRVLVNCKPAGTGRVAVVVRIVGGAPELRSSTSP